MGRTWLMPLPPGVTDPIFVCTLAMDLGMTITEVGERMSAHELTVVWPQFYAYRQREAQRQQEREGR